jgi:hypothetical protein
VGTTPVEKWGRACRDHAEKVLGANEPPTCGFLQANDPHVLWHRIILASTSIHQQSINWSKPRSSMAKFNHTPIKPQKSNHKFFPVEPTP